MLVMTLRHISQDRIAGWGSGRDQFGVMNGCSPPGTTAFTAGSELWMIAIMPASVARLNTRKARDVMRMMLYRDAAAAAFVPSS
jgi:hypothetical protein